MKHFSIVKLIIFLTIGVQACKVGSDSSQGEVVTSEATTELPLAAPLPEYLREVRPAPSSVLSIDEFHHIVDVSDEVLESEEELFLFPPMPPVEYVGYRSSICIDLNPDPLVQPGDFFLVDTDIWPRTTLTVDNQELARTPRYVFPVIFQEPGPWCRCYYDCDDWEYPYDFDEIPENTGCAFELGFLHCYPVSLEAGIHEITYSFELRSGTVESYDWSFMLLSSAAPIEDDS